MTDFFGYLALALLALIVLYILWVWWQKFVANRPDRYGKGPGHDLRGAERGQWHRGKDD
ncbi:hypothetical protein KDD17_16935 [Sulfitobacter albidus]|uniref:Uncharacterized protein n=1 Tax=Sulfitobacter albidus TaxID=2829501 RepID=A0A975PNT2_9RHOB|nr:hypothetical protein [Sulfitobacter albidus]QUJ78182.1 hypothetical protein KDD17_16935 [Sulfitobacter albidus]